MFLYDLQVAAQQIPVGPPEKIAMPTTSYSSAAHASGWVATPDWVQSWKHKLPLQTIMRLLQVLVPQVEKICIDQ